MTDYMERKKPQLKWGQARCVICHHATTAEPGKPVLCGLEACHAEYAKRNTERMQSELPI